MSAVRHLLVLTMVLGWASPSAAQIYSWRDADGKLVLSNTPRAGGGAQTTYEVHGAAPIKSTDAARSQPQERSLRRLNQ